MLQENYRIIRSDDSVQEQALTALRVKWHGASCCDTTQKKLVVNNCEVHVNCYYVGRGLSKAFSNEILHDNFRKRSLKEVLKRAKYYR